jgi:hypothetical protein
VIVVLAVFFVTGYYNLTAVELVAGVLIFSWIIVFLRNAGTAGRADAAPPALASEASLAPAASATGEPEPSVV